MVRTEGGTDGGFAMILRAARPLAACARRRRALAPLARDILAGRGDGRALAPAAWAAIFALARLLLQGADAGSVLVPSLALFAVLCLIAVFDARYFVIPDGPIAFLAATGLATVVLTAPQEAASRLAAGAIAFAALRAVAFAYETLRGAPGVGEGDAKLYGVAGLWIGLSGLPGCLLYAVLSALLSAALAMRQGALSHAREPIPFGPHLALGLWLVWSIGPLEFG